MRAGKRPEPESPGPRPSGDQERPLVGGRLVEGAGRVDQSLEALLLLVGERSAPVIALQGTEHALVRPGPLGGALDWCCIRTSLPGAVPPGCVTTCGGFLRCETSLPEISSYV